MVVGVFLTLKIYRRNMVPGGHKINILYFINSILNLNKAQQCTVVVVNGFNRRTELSSCFIVEMPSQVNALKAEQAEPDQYRVRHGEEFPWVHVHYANFFMLIQPFSPLLYVAVIIVILHKKKLLGSVFCMSVHLSVVDLILESLRLFVLLALTHPIPALCAIP